MALLVKLILAHLLGDFVLQFNSWVKGKQQKKLKSPFLYIHAGVHFLLILLVTWNLDLWKLALFVSVSHFIIDTLKLYVSEKTTKIQWPFFVDQFLHVVILVIAVFYGNWNVFAEGFTFYFNWKIVTAYVFLSFPVGIIMDKCLTGWSVEQNNEASLPNAGKVIGIVERLLVLTFILLNQWEAIGFLITAKSVFRFNDLKASNRKLTEYILIGTLLSFGIAIFTGVLVVLYGV